LKIAARLARSGWAIDELHVARALWEQEGDDALAPAGRVDEDDGGFRRAIAEIEIALGDPDVGPGELGGKVSARSIEHTGVRSVPRPMKGGKDGAQPVTVDHRDDRFPNGGLLPGRPSDRRRWSRRLVAAIGAMT
jgi:hypothetical protein